MTRCLAIVLAISLAANFALLLSRTGSSHVATSNDPAPTGSEARFAAARDRLARCETVVSTARTSHATQATSHLDCVRSSVSSEVEASPPSPPQDHVAASSEATPDSGQLGDLRMLLRVDENRLQLAGLHPEEIQLLLRYLEGQWSELEQWRSDPLSPSDGSTDRARKEFERARVIELAGRQAARRVRREFGDDVYDAFLYATTQPNRVEIQELFTGSPGLIAGLERGDAVLRYGGSRVFTSQELLDAIDRSDRSRPVAVEIERSGRHIQLDVAPGRLGALLADQTRSPGT